MLCNMSDMVLLISVLLLPICIQDMLSNNPDSHLVYLIWRPFSLTEIFTFWRPLGGGLPVALCSEWGWCNALLVQSPWKDVTRVHSLSVYLARDLMIMCKLQTRFSKNMGALSAPSFVPFSLWVRAFDIIMIRVWPLLKGRSSTMMSAILSLSQRMYISPAATSLCGNRRWDNRA